MNILFLSSASAFSAYNFTKAHISAHMAAHSPALACVWTRACFRLRIALLLPSASSSAILISVKIRKNNLFGSSSSSIRVFGPIVCVLPLIIYYTSISFRNCGVQLPIQLKIHTLNSIVVAIAAVDAIINDHQTELTNLCDVNACKYLKCSAEPKE